MNNHKSLELTIDRCISKAEGVLPEVVPTLRQALAKLKSLTLVCDSRRDRKRLAARKFPVKSVGPS